MRRYIEEDQEKIKKKKKKKDNKSKVSKKDLGLTENAKIILE